MVHGRVGAAGRHLRVGRNDFLVDSGTVGRQHCPPHVWHCRAIERHRATKQKVGKSREASCRPNVWHARLAFRVDGQREALFTMPARVDRLENRCGLARYAELLVEFADRLASIVSAEDAFAERRLLLAFEGTRGVEQRAGLVDEAAVLEFFVLGRLKQPCKDSHRGLNGNAAVCASDAARQGVDELTPNVFQPLRHESPLCSRHIAVARTPANVDLK